MISAGGRPRHTLEHRRDDLHKNCQNGNIVKRFTLDERTARSRIHSGAAKNIGSARPPPAVRFDDGRDPGFTGAPEILGDGRNDPGPIFRVFLKNYGIFRRGHKGGTLIAARSNRPAAVRRIEFDQSLKASRRSVPSGKYKSPGRVCPGLSNSVLGKQSRRLQDRYELEPRCSHKPIQNQPPRSPRSTKRFIKGQLGRKDHHPGRRQMRDEKFGSHLVLLKMEFEGQHKVDLRAQPRETDLSNWPAQVVLDLRICLAPRSDKKAGWRSGANEPKAAPEAVRVFGGFFHLAHHAGSFSF